jgi:hypothetical protein
MFSVWGILLAETSLAGPSTVERPADGVCIVRDDAGIWGGPSIGITHQLGAEYEARKILDLSAGPESLWQAVTGVRLSAHF